MKILLLGRKGQLGSRFEQFLLKKPCELLAVGRQECDLSFQQNVLNLLNSFQPEIIINTVAYNAVDAAESQKEMAWLINASLPQWLADWCDQTGARLVHYSTDYVFDGQKKLPYTEQDVPSPLNEYGCSKLAGEQRVTKIKNHLVFRVSWVFGGSKQNFLHKVDEWLARSTSVAIACDEISVPTSVDTIILGTWLALQKNLNGLFHLSNVGYASRWEWAKFYLKLLGRQDFIYPAYQKDFHLPAPRPRFSVLDANLLQKELKITLPTWEEEMLRLYSTRENLWDAYGIQ